MGKGGSRGGCCVAPPTLEVACWGVLTSYGHMKQSRAGDVGSDPASATAAASDGRISHRPSTVVSSEESSCDRRVGEESRDRTRLSLTHLLPRAHW